MQSADSLLAALGAQRSFGGSKSNFPIKIRYIVYLFYRLQGGLQDGTQRREFGENVQVPPKDEPGWE